MSIHCTLLRFLYFARFNCKNMGYAGNDLTMLGYLGKEKKHEVFR